MMINTDDSLELGFYNQDNYDNWAEAEKDGAVYYVPSPISLYGYGGLFDISEIATTFSKCVGIGNFVAVVKTRGGDYYEVSKVIEEGLKRSLPNSE